MKLVKLAALLLPLMLGFAALPQTAAAGQSAAPRLTADRIAMLLDRLHAPARLPLTPVDSSCATTCGSGPEGSCTKSCPSSQSCSATCSGGKAVCSCQ
jgi:hypothetical protein